MTDKKHNHYFKDVKHLDYIDVYRVLDLFQVTDPCIQHAVKKLLVAGNRGHKDLDKDIQDVIDSCLRFQEMRREESEKTLSDYTHKTQVPFRYLNKFYRMDMHSNNVNFLSEKNKYD